MAIIGGINLGNLTDYLFVFTNGSKLAGWIGATNGYVGDVAIDGIQANENASGGTLAYAGTIFTNDVTCDEWQMIVDQNPGQAFCSTGNVALIAGLETDLANAFAQIEALPVTPGFESVNSFSLDGLNTQNGVNELIVINITSGFSIGSKINIFGDPGDVYVFRWDQDANPANGYQGQVNFHGGGAFVPASPGMKPTNFINVAGSISSSGGGTNPPPPYPQGPRFNDGQGALINGGSDFKGGGFFTGYWLTKGDPVLLETGSIGNARFVGGWFSSTVEFQLHSGAGGVYVSPNPATEQTLGITVLKEVSVDNGATFQDANTPPFPVLFPPTNPIFRYTITNTGNVTLDNVTLTDSNLGPLVLPTTTLAPGASTSVVVPGNFAPGDQCNTATATGQGAGQTVTASDIACYVGALQEPCISLIKLVSVNGGQTFVDADTPPGPTLISPTNPIFRFSITNCGPLPVNNITLVDSVLGPIPVPPTLFPGQTFTVDVIGTFGFGENCNVATVTGIATDGTPVTDSGRACYTGRSGAELDLVKLISVDNGVTFISANDVPFPVLIAPNNPIYQWVVTNNGTVPLTNVALVDTDFGPIAIPTTTLAPGESFTVQLTGTFAPNDHCNNATVTGTGDQGTISAVDFACYVGQTSGIDLVKEVSVDGGLTFQDANTPPGPTLVFPQNPVYRFTVTNTGAAALTNVTVNDSDFGLVIGPINLAPGASSSVIVPGTFVLGEHCNLATATGTADGVTVTDQDSACFTGVPEQAPAIDVLKEVSVDGGLTFQDANNPPGPNLVSPTNPVFRFTVTNVGNQTLTNVTVTDSALGLVIGPIVLAPGQSAQATIAGVFALGQHANLATAVGTGENGVIVTDEDPANFFGVLQPPPAPSIDLIKEVSADGGLTFHDANTAPGPDVVFPTNPIFRFRVTNTGNLPINGIVLVDNVLGPIAIPVVSLLPGQSFTVIVPGTWAAGQHCNCARVTGVAANGQIVTDVDRAFWVGRKSAVPVFPDISGPAPQNEIIDRLLETVALEELALAALINAEAEKVQAVAAAGIMGPIDPEDLVNVNHAVAEVIRLAGVKEAHLRRKLNRILAHKEQPTPGTCADCPPGPTTPPIL